MESKETTEIKKPDFLYHASSNSNTDVIEPKRNSFRDPGEGKVVFATSSKPYASMFLVRGHDDWTHKGRFNGVYYTVINDRERFKNLDKGGSIYFLPSDTFSYDESKGMGSIEWTSKVKVTPVKREGYRSGLNAMIDNGVQVYFVDKETWKKINESDDHGFRILSELESENKKVNRNYLNILGEE